MSKHKGKTPARSIPLNTGVTIVPTPKYKALNWSVKFEAEGLKALEFKDFLNLAGSYDLDATAEHVNAVGGPAKETRIPLSDVPGDLTILLLVVKVDAANTKDILKPLKVRLDLPANPAAVPPVAADKTADRDMNVDAAKAGIAFARIFKDPFSTKAKTWDLVIGNPNLTDIPVQIQVVYGKDK